MKFLLSTAFWFVVILTLTACSGGSKEAPVVARQLGGAIQGKGLHLSGTVTTIAGPVPGAADGIGAGAKFECPVGMASDGTNIFITDPVNHTIRRMVISTGEVTTLAGTPGFTGTTDSTGAAARFNSPTGIATDGTNLYILDSNNCTIRKISIATGVVQTIAGSAGNRGVTDGTGAAARFAWLQAITTDGTSLFVADGNTIRRVDLATGAVTTLAGSPTMYTMNTVTTAVSAGNGDGTGTSAFFRDIRGITTDGSNLFVSDNNTIRQVVIASAVVTTLAGDSGGSNYYGPLDGTGTAARFGYAAGITNDGTNLYILDSNMVRKVVIATAKVTTVGNTSWQADSESSMVMTTSAYYSAGVTAVGGALFIGDSTNRVIRRITIATGVGETVAGFLGLGSADGTGAKALFNNPGGITTDGPILYVADRGNCTIRKIELATGTVSTLAGSAGKMGLVDGTGSDARFRNLQGITTDGSALYVTDGYTIRKVDAASGKVTTLFNWSVDHPTAYTGGTMNNVPYYSDITTDGTSLFIADRTTISKIVIATGELSTLAGSDLSGWADGFGGGATFGWIGGLTTDGTSLYVADSSNSLIRKVTIATGEVTTLAGRPNAWGSTDGYGSDATFANPIGMTTDGTSLYITENYGCAIRKLVLATGEVTTLAGTNTNRIARDGAATAAGFAAPAGITTDGRSLFVTDGIGMIRRVD